MDNNLSPDQFLLWWFDNADTHGLTGQYRMFYSNYFDARYRIPYVWSHFSRRMRYLETIPLQGKRLLDVGCGLGTEILWAALRGANATGIELHQESLNIARQRADLIKDKLTGSIELRDMNLLDVQGQYDIVFLRETFHHLEPRAEIVAKLASLLSKDGMLVIEETNGWNPLIQLKYLWVRRLHTVVRKTRPDGTSYLFGNERITTSNNLDRLFRPYGILGKTEYFRLLPTSLAKNKVIAAFAKRLEHTCKNSLLLRPFFLHYSWVGMHTPQPSAHT